MRIGEEEVEVDGGGAKGKRKRGLDGMRRRMVWRIRTQYSVLVQL